MVGVDVRGAHHLLHVRNLLFKAVTVVCVSCQPQIQGGRTMGWEFQGCADAVCCTFPGLYLHNQAIARGDTHTAVKPLTSSKRACGSGRLDTVHFSSMSQNVQGGVHAVGQGCGWACAGLLPSFQGHKGFALVVLSTSTRVASGAHGFLCGGQTHHQASGDIVAARYLCVFVSLDGHPPTSLTKCKATSQDGLLHHEERHHCQAPAPLLLQPGWKP